MRAPLRLLLALALLAALAAPAAADPPAPATPGDDAVVIAVVDSGFSPYHEDLDAALMPQHLDATDANDLPLDTAPHTWLAGFPQPETFATYDEISLTRGGPGARTADLQAADRDEWDAFARTTSDGDDVHYRWLSGSKVIGAVDFSGRWLGSNDAHGAKVSSVSAGTQHGTCPECLVVLVTYDSSDRGAYERASDWAMRQPWIDVVTNSYGYSTVLLEKVYTGSSLEVSREAVERGQEVFYSAGNGQANAFTAPTSTYYSSQKAADWVVSVGAVHPGGQAYSGAGKNVDIASVGSGYPSMGGTTTDGQSTFSGTSNATPVSAGTYARALWDVRQQLAGPSRTQADGVIATGEPVTCGTLAPDCELGDGVLTRGELEQRFYAATTRTDAGLTVSQVVRPGPRDLTTDEVELLSTGHGVLFGRRDNPVTGETWGAEHDRIVGPMLGTAEAPVITADTRDFMVVDSFCRQQAWGPWDQGLYTGTLPAASPEWPARTALAEACPALDAVFEGAPSAAVPTPVDDHDEG